MAEVKREDVIAYLEKATMLEISDLIKDIEKKGLLLRLIKHCQFSKIILINLSAIWKNFSQVLHSTLLLSKLTMFRSVLIIFLSPK